MSDKMRLDVAVFERGLAETREKAKALIMAGSVYLNGQKALKGGAAVKDTDIIEVRGAVNPYVSRGGLKLHKAVQNFGLSLEGCVCMDIGASTGGFTDCMLSNGAAKVYAIDVGYGQLAWKLRCDERVVNMERTNFRYVTHEQIPEQVDFIDRLPDYDTALFVSKKMKTNEETSLAALKAALPRLEALEDFSQENIHEAMFTLIGELGVKNGWLLWPLRVAVSGKQFTPGGGIELCAVLGREESLARIRAAVEKLS